MGKTIQEWAPGSEAAAEVAANWWKSMRKKNFKTSIKPQPTREAIDEYVNEGHGRDVQSVNAEMQKHRK